MEALEFAIRAGVHQAGGVLLERLINADGGGYAGTRIPCRHGHLAEFVEYRSKTVTTVLSSVEVRRAYYYCKPCGAGIIPKDAELDVVDTSFSPGVRRLMGRVGGKEAFEEGREDLEELAGVSVTTKSVERVSEQIGRQIEEGFRSERALAWSGKLVALASAVPKMYIAIDGTGVPVVPRETVGRKGKQTERAKTREAKLGCVFTQTTVDEDGWPVRDPASTTYVGAIETAEPFGRRIYGEALRRGMGQAERVIVLGDGAPWIWGVAEMHFAGAIQIVDLYHAREHLSNLANLLYGPATLRARDWTAARRDKLDAGDVDAVIGSMERLRPHNQKLQEQVDQQIGYFRTNAQRMRYAEFRSQGLFVGSGVVEAGCKTIIGLRLKQSGMRWTVCGANDIIALRCCQLSGRWEQFWENRVAG